MLKKLVNAIECGYCESNTKLMGGYLVCPLCQTKYCIECGEEILPNMPHICKEVVYAKTG